VERDVVDAISQAVERSEWVSFSPTIEGNAVAKLLPAVGGARWWLSQQAVGAEQGEHVAASAQKGSCQLAQTR